MPLSWTINTLRKGDGWVDGSRETRPNVTGWVCASKTAIFNYAMAPHLNVEDVLQGANTNATSYIITWQHFYRQIIDWKINRRSPLFTLRQRNTSQQSVSNASIKLHWKKLTLSMHTNLKDLHQNLWEYYIRILHRAKSIDILHVYNIYTIILLSAILVAIR